MDRLRLTGYAVAQFFLAIVLIVLLVLWIVGGVLVVIWVGLGIVTGCLFATRWIANLHRVMAARTLGEPIPDPYRPLPQGGFFAKARAVLADPMTWRDLAWVFVAPAVGIVVSLVVVILLLGVVTGFIWWFVTPPLMRARAMFDRFFLAYSRTEKLEQRVHHLTESRADLVDHSAAELRRLERDLHDGAQARLVALSMSLGMADAAFEADPEQARRLVQDARATTTAAIGDLRSVVRGIHPPVLADRGLGGAVEAIALDMAIPVHVEVRLSGRPPAPVESAVYFGVAECLANIGKHAAARHAWIILTHEPADNGGTLRAIVGDDGRGGADPGSGTGMLGVMRRLAAFDGTMSVSSPAGGPTLVTLEVPCSLAPTPDSSSSSPRTTPSSGPG
ncbi:sensor histidine kinase [Nocardioides sp. YIM 152315]|uniref:sensor histidine kinase n=1 Tax=Nocardioides sp. YIM 152315 TaxID=3031760 RepID=UPI0023DBBA9C|nr:sensor histidine kinase [Nocardioides sp. YIM 152315]MDF1602745.1 sensor domain-containing protein [Nocardioides sp. YIM 152315]